MNVSNQIKELTRRKNVTTTELSNMLGTSQGNLANKLTRDNFRVNELEEIAHALGYTQMEIVLRGHKDDAIILEDDVKYQKHNIYMVFDENTSLLEDIKTNGFRDTTFRLLLLEVLGETLEPQFRQMFGDTLDAYVPNDFKEGFKDVIKQRIDKLNLGNVVDDIEDF